MLSNAPRFKNELSVCLIIYTPSNCKELNLSWVDLGCKTMVGDHKITGCLPSQLLDHDSLFQVHYCKPLHFTRVLR